MRGIKLVRKSGFPLTVKSAIKAPRDVLYKKCLGIGSFLLPIQKLKSPEIKNVVSLEQLSDLFFGEMLKLVIQSLP